MDGYGMYSGPSCDMVDDQYLGPSCDMVDDHARWLGRSFNMMDGHAMCSDPSNKIWVYIRSKPIQFSQCASYRMACDFFQSNPIRSKLILGWMIGFGNGKRLMKY